MNGIHEARDRGLDIPPGILEIPREQMRRLGYSVVDRVIEHLTSLEGQPAVREVDRSTLESRVGGPVPRSPGDLESSLELLAEFAIPAQQHGDHPRYFARVPGPSSFPGILGDWLSTGTQSIASSWGGGSGPTAVELVACGWLQEALGLPSSSESILVSGGSMANVTAVIAARSQKGPGVVYLSGQTHSSIGRGLSAVGQQLSDVRVIECDDSYRMSFPALRDQLETDVRAGLRPTMVIATAGTTNTGAVDDLVRIAHLCRAHDVWLHVDGAYGVPAALCERGRRALPGLGLADSVVVDPHKWLFQPYDIACLFVAHPGVLESTFAMHPEYLADVVGREVDLHNRGLELTRRSRGIKLWLTLRSFGLDMIGQAIERGIALAEHAQRVIQQDESLEIVTPARLGIVTFAARSANDADHSRAVRLLNESGYAAVSTTVLSERTVLRLCTINPRTTTDDIEGTVRRLAQYLAAA